MAKTTRRDVLRAATGMVAAATIAAPALGRPHHRKGDQMTYHHHNLMAEFDAASKASREALLASIENELEELDTLLDEALSNPDTEGRRSYLHGFRERIEAGDDEGLAEMIRGEGEATWETAGLDEMETILTVKLPAFVMGLIDAERWLAAEALAAA